MNRHERIPIVIQLVDLINKQGRYELEFTEFEVIHREQLFVYYKGENKPIKTFRLDTDCPKYSHKVDEMIDYLLTLKN